MRDNVGIAICLIVIGILVYFALPQALEERKAEDAKAAQHKTLADSP